jgi:nuclear pore complex protein Nup133
MDQVNPSGDEDVIRAFFRHHVQDLDRLLEIVFSSLKALISDGDLEVDVALWIVEANSIFLVSRLGLAIYNEHRANT